jgi:hypothetical protein
MKYNYKVYVGPDMLGIIEAEDKVSAKKQAVRLGQAYPGEPVRVVQLGPVK